MNQFGKRRKRKLGGRTLPASLKRMAKNAGVRITLKRCGKRAYKSASMIRAQIKNKKKRRNHFGEE